MLKRLVAALTTALLAVGLTLGSALPASAATADVTAACNPLSPLRNFTILTEGDFRNDTSGAHVEGTLAAGGDLVVTQRYSTQNNHDGSPLPVVGGTATGLLVGGQATLDAPNQAFLVMAGAARVGTVPATAAMKEGGKRYHPVAANSSFVEVTSATTLDQLGAPGLFASTFSGAFTALRGQADRIAGYSAGTVAFVTMTSSPNGGKQVVLTAGVTNVLRVSAAQLSGAGNLWFAGGVVPSASTPFVVDVTDAGAVAVTAPVLRNIDARHVLWNFAQATTIGLSNAEFVKGSILAPRAALTVNSGGIEGQIAVRSLVIRSVGELHHLSYLSCLPQPTSVSGAATTAAEVCTADYAIAPGSVTATPATGVRYELWDAAKTTKLADLVAGTPYAVDGGAYAVKVIAVGAAYVVPAADTWIPVTVGAYPGVCAEEVSGAATTAAEYCDTADHEVKPGSVTATARAGVVYELWDATKTTKLADLVAGTPYLVGGGSYAVKVLPAAATFTVAPANTWIAVTVGDVPGGCAQSVSGAATTTGEVCETSPYDVAEGSVTATAATGVVYELWNAAKTTKLADLVAGTPHPVAGGSYAVKVLPASAAYTVSPADTWIAVEVDVNTTVCAVIGDPVQTEECVPDVDADSSTWSASLTIVAVDHVQYRVHFLDGGSWVDQGVWPAGVHVAGTPELPYGTTLKVVAEAEAGWNLLAPAEWTYEFQDAFLCDLPDFGIVEPTVTFDQSCSAGATYTLAIDGGVEGTVLWSVNGGSPSTKLGTFPAPASGTVQIVATPAPGSGFPGQSATLTFGTTFAASVLCDLETLALTGQSSTGAVILAIALLQAGLVLVAVRFARRSRGRHVAG